MSVFLWILQIVLAVMLLMIGMMNQVQPKETIAGMMPVFEAYSPATIRLIGVAEIAAAVGLILPAWTGIAVVFTPLAALGIIILVLLAARAHAKRKGRP